MGEQEIPETTGANTGEPYTDTKEKPEEVPTVLATTEGWPDSVCLRPHDYCEEHNGSYVIFVLKLASWNLMKS